MADAALFPKTRYLGSKRKLLGALKNVFSDLSFDTALDPFSGTGAVAYLLKTMGKQVTASDVLESNAVNGRALVANSHKRLGRLADDLTADLPSPRGPAGFIEDTFADVFFEADENRFLDGILPRIHDLDGPHRDLALHALFQACLAKRPYNLFHRANLAMRRRDVSRSFGNKTTWDRPFAQLFKRYAAEADRAVFDSGRTCFAERADVLGLENGDFDLVYLDPPYIAGGGTGVDYLDYYHFLEGLSSPRGWAGKILHRYKHKPLAGRGESPWSDPKRIQTAFEDTIKRFSKSKLVISYRSDGIPSISAIQKILERTGKKAQTIDAGRYVYALSRNRKSREVIIVSV